MELMYMRMIFQGFNISLLVVVFSLFCIAFFIAIFFFQEIIQWTNTIYIINEYRVQLHVEYYRYYFIVIYIVRVSFDNYVPTRFTFRWFVDWIGNMEIATDSLENYGTFLIRRIKRLESRKTHCAHCQAARPLSFGSIVTYFCLQLMKPIQNQKWHIKS